MSGVPNEGRGTGTRTARPRLAVFVLLLAWALTASVATIPVFAIPIAAAQTTASAFVDGFDELPLFPGVEQVPDSTVAFDTTGGRIVISFVRTALAAPTFLDRYAETLRQLGWTRAGEARFLREGEVLTFDFIADGAKSVVRFSLVPE
jgi:hypothetical protein